MTVRMPAARILPKSSSPCAGDAVSRVIAISSGSTKMSPTGFNALVNWAWSALAWRNCQ
jgi:hypothetical protein